MIPVKIFLPHVKLLCISIRSAFTVSFMWSYPKLNDHFAYGFTFNTHHEIMSPPDMVTLSSSSVGVFCERDNFWIVLNLTFKLECVLIT